MLTENINPPPTRPLWENLAGYFLIDEQLKKDYSCQCNHFLGICWLLNEVTWASFSFVLFPYHEFILTKVNLNTSDISCHWEYVIPRRTFICCFILLSLSRSHLDFVRLLHITSYFTWGRGESYSLLSPFYSYFDKV